MSNTRECRRGLKHRQGSQQSMDEAINLIKAGVIGVTEASRTYDIPRNTIADRIKNKVDIDCNHIGRATNITRQQEEDLCKFIGYMAGRGFPLTINQITKYAWGIDKMSGKNIFGLKSPSQKWWDNFRLRHKNSSSR